MIAKIASRRTVKQQRADILVALDQRFTPLQHPWNDDVVGDHDGERHRLHDHHGGRGRQPADKGQDGEEVGAGAERQRQHEHVAVNIAGRDS